jgi:hypothetical protein
MAIWAKQPIFSRAVHARLCRLLLFFIAAAASFNGYYDKHHLMDSIAINGVQQFHARNTFASMLDGSAERPFVYRRLLPDLANWIDRQIPPRLHGQIYNARTHSGDLLINRFWSAPLARDRQYFLRYRLVYFLVFLFAWIAACAFFHLGKAAGFNRVESSLAAVSMLLIFPYFLEFAGYFYDYPELAFFVLALVVALRGKTLLLIPLAALATWNKESFLFFLPTLYPLMRRRASRRGALSALLPPILVSLAINLAIHHQYRHNPGLSVEVHLAEQIRDLPNFFHLLPLSQTYGIPLPRTENILWLLLMAATWAWGRPLLAPALRQHLLLALTINLPLFLVLGYPSEIRGMSMLCPALFLLLCALIRQHNNGPCEHPTQARKASEVFQE